MWLTMQNFWDLEVQYLCQAVLCLNSFSWTHVLGFFCVINFLAKEEMADVSQQQFNVQEGKITFPGSRNIWEESRETLI